MEQHPLRTLIEAADKAITAEDFDRLMDFYDDNATLVVKPGLNACGKAQIRRAFEAIAQHFGNCLVVKQGNMIVIEGGDTALVIMETLLYVPGEKGTEKVRREATYVFRKDQSDQWLCTVDNSYGTSLLTHS